MGCICICKIIPTTHPNLPHSCKLHLWELNPGPSDLRVGVFDHYTNMPLGWGVLPLVYLAAGWPCSWLDLLLLWGSGRWGVLLLGGLADGEFCFWVAWQMYEF